jgi:putative oxidoreductase
MFAATDALAARSSDAILLIGRVFIGWLFLASGWPKVTNIQGFVKYLASLGVTDLLAWPAAIAEVAIGVALILGVATRYVSLFAVVYLIITILVAHRYWAYPAAQQGNQFAHFLKNLAIIGGTLMLYVTGAGRYAVDRMMRR